MALVREQVLSKEQVGSRPRIASNTSLSHTEDDEMSVIKIV